MVSKARSCVRYAHTKQRRKTIREKKEEEEKEEERERERKRKDLVWLLDVAAGDRLKSKLFRTAPVR